MLGSPSAVLSSDTALLEFCNKLSCFTQPRRCIWNVYIDRADTDFCRLILKVQQWRRNQLWTNELWCVRCSLRYITDLDEKALQFLCGDDQGLSMFTLNELQELLLPMLHSINASKTHISAVEQFVRLAQQHAALQGASAPAAVQDPLPLLRAEHADQPAAQQAQQPDADADGDQGEALWGGQPLNQLRLMQAFPQAQQQQWRQRQQLGVLDVQQALQLQQEQYVQIQQQQRRQEQLRLLALA
jgi:hypothetical protein